MIWHIFRKDCRLLWPLALAVVGANISYRALLAWLAFFQDARLVPIVNLLTVLSLMGTATLIAMVVQQDALPGVRQDWLVRPIRRRDLFLSKLLFTVVVVQGPIFLIETLTCFANGFPAGQSFSAALARSLYLFLAFDLPVLAFATLTRNLVEAIGGALGATLLFVIIQTLRQFAPVSGVMFTPLEWVIDSTQIVAGIAGAAVVIALQYSLRRIAPARWVAFTAGLLWAAAQVLPVQPAFAIQSQLGRNASAGNRVEIAFAPSIGRFHGLPGVNYNERLHRAGVGGSYADVFLPVSLSGVRRDELLRSDLSQIRITTAAGQVVNLQRGGELERSEEPNDSEQQPGHQLIWIPEELYLSIRDQPVKVEIDYLLTLLDTVGVQSMAALGGDVRTGYAGRCRTGVNVAGTSVQWRCAAPGVAPACFSASLENPQTGQRNPEINRCNDYLPYKGETLFGDSVTRYGTALPYRDPGGIAQYPVDGTQLRTSRVVFRIFRPEAHFERKLLVDDVRLNDWVVE